MKSNNAPKDYFNLHINPILSTSRLTIHITKFNTYKILLKLKLYKMSE